jgi:hypothetical protein
VFVSPTAPAAPMSLQLAHAAHRVLDARRPFSPHDYDYFTDLLSTYGLLLHDDGFAAGRLSFTDLVAGLVPDLGEYADRFDLAVMASLTSDSEPGWPMCYLNLAVPKPGLAFAVADQGVLAPFTAMNLVVAWARRDGIERALVFVLDQTTVLHTEPIADRLRATEDSGVVLVLNAASGTAGDAAIDAPEPVPATPDRVPRLWAEIVSRTGVGAIVTGRSLADLVLDSLDGTETVIAPEGRPCSGPWSALAQRLPRWKAEGKRVIIADYDAEAQRLGWCGFAVSARSKEERNG